MISKAFLNGWIESRLKPKSIFFCFVISCLSFFLQSTRKIDRKLSFTCYVPSVVQFTICLFFFSSFIFLALCLVRAYYKVTSFPAPLRIITPKRKAIDQRADETTKAARDNWPSPSHENQKLTRPWSCQTWKARLDRCDTASCERKGSTF